MTLAIALTYLVEAAGFAGIGVGAYLGLRSGPPRQDGGGDQSDQVD